MGVLVSGLNAGNYNVPSGFYLKKNSYGAKLYKNSSINMYAIVLDVDKGDIDFGVTENAYLNLFNRYSIKHWWNSEYEYSNFAMINGQFFNHHQNPTVLSFPLKSDGDIIAQYMDNSLAKKTLLRTWDGNFYIKKGYYNSLLTSDSTKDLLVGLSPNVDVGGKKWWPIGRNYIGGIPRGSCNPDQATCQYKYLIFFIGEGFSQPNFLSRIKHWGVKESSIVMMDGSASSQIKSGSTEMYGYQYPGLSYGTKRKIPNIITIKKW
jgi:hypothetical protein